MSTSNLITPERAKFNINLTTYTDDEDQTIDALIASASRQIERYCHRHFQLAEYDELLSGDVQPRLFLKHLPIVSVQRVATNKTGVLEITNTSWPTNSRATVQVESTGLKLVRVASGVTYPDSSVLWATYVTVNAVATAVDALGNGWDASVPDSNYGTYASEDIKSVQGALSAANSQRVALYVHTEEESDYDVEEKVGALYKPGGWDRGKDNYRVVYTAGFEETPEDIQEACAILVAGGFKQTQRDPFSSMTKTADFSYNASESFMLPFPRNVLRLIGPYVLRTL